MRVVGITAVAAVLLAGCALSLEEISQREPEFVKTTTKSPEKYQECVLRAWVDDYLITQSVPTETGYTLYARASGIPAHQRHVLEIARVDGGSRVTLRSPHYTGHFNSNKQAEACL